MNNITQPEEKAEMLSLQLASVLDSKVAPSLYRDILVHRGHDLVLDASEVTRLGGQCLQVLLAAVCAWRADGKNVFFDRPSTPFILALDMFGFDPKGGVHNERLA